MKPLLEIQDITVSFSGFKVLDHISFNVMPKSIQVIVGPNGAGKSTLMDTIIGCVRPTSGKVIFKGEDITSLPEYEIVRRGICRKFQVPGILPTLTVEENIMIAAKKNRDWLHTFSRKKTETEKNYIDQVLTLIKLTEEKNKLAMHLAHGAKQSLEIGMVIASGSDLILLDEPTAGLTKPEEREKTAELIKNLKERHTVIVIDHDIDFVASLNAPVTVLHNGRVLKQGSIAEIRQDVEVRAVYLGREGVFHARSE